MNKKILLIEDEQLRIEVMLSALKKYFNVLLATTGEEGLEAVKKEKPDLIVLDLFLPKMKGADVLRKLQDDPQTEDIPVIILTHLENEETYQEIKSIGDFEYLIKSNYTIDEIVDKIKEKLESQKHREDTKNTE